MRVRLVVVAVLTALVALALVAGIRIGRGGDSAPASGADPVSSANPSGREAEDEASADTGRREVRSPEDLLSVHVTVEGHVARATVAVWSASSLDSALDSAAVRPPDASATASLDGTARFAVGGGQWTVVSAWVPDQNLVAQRCLQPAGGARDVTFDLSRGSGALEVLVLESDLRTPAAGQTVRLVRTDVSGDAAGWVDVAASRTDALGRVCFADLESGTYVVLAPEAGRDAKPPHVASVLLLAGVPGREQTCVLVVPSRTVPARLILLGEGGPLPGTAIQPFLRRRDDDSGLAVPLPFLTPGLREVPLDLPPGDYELDALPIGAVTISGDRLLVVRDGQRNELSARLTVQEPSVLLVLEGVERTDFPVRVAFECNGDISFLKPGIDYVGPLSWRRAEGRVAPTSTPVVVTATGRRGCFESIDPVVVRGVRCAVPMRRARPLQVQWFGWDAARDLGSVLVVSQPGRERVHGLTADLARNAGQQRPVLAAELIVGTGQAVVEVMRPDGSIAWRRSVEAGDRRAMLRVLP